MGRINASKRFKWMFCKTQQMRERERPLYNQFHNQSSFHTLDDMQATSLEQTSHAPDLIYHHFHICKKIPICIIILTRSTKSKLT